MGAQGPALGANHAAKKLTYDQFVSYVRSALHHLYDPDHLRRSPLAVVLDVADRADTPAALQRILTRSIQALEPGANESPESRAWRIHDALVYRYIRRLDSSLVADQIGVSARQLRREQRAALEVLADHLWIEYALGGVEPAGGAPESGAQTGAEAVGPQTSSDLDWLKNAPPDKPTDVGKQLAVILDLINGLAQQYGVRVSSDIPDGLPEVAADPVAFRETLLNLLCAVIPRLAGGCVTIGARLVRWEVELTVSSSSSFAESPAESEDMGRGLDMATQLAHLCGGTLVVDAGPLLFRTTLTLPALGYLPVLVIDDNADAHQLFQRYVAGTRYRVVGVREPDQATPLVQELSPRVIVLDLMMPNTDGWDVLGRLRNDPATSRVAIVVCSILPQEALAQSLGANAFIRKPVSRLDFLKVLDRLTRDAASGTRAV